MANYTYSFKSFDSNTMARALGMGLSISTKKSIETCTFIRGKKVEAAKKMLQEVIDMKRAVPLKRFRWGAGHKTGIGPGKYPINVCTGILSILNSAQNNAQTKGLDANSLSIIHISAQRGPHDFHHGRQSRRAFKRTHIEIVLGTKEEKEDKKKGQKKDQAKEQKKETAQTKPKEPKTVKSQSKVQTTLIEKEQETIKQ